LSDTLAVQPFPPWVGGVADGVTGGVVLGGVVLGGVVVPPALRAFRTAV
jgi:hypothetical protein